jgi:CheY-like chemotaxis protein
MRQVLVVDGKGGSRELIRVILASSGYTVSKAGEGGEANRTANRTGRDPARSPDAGAGWFRRANPRFTALATGERP